MDPEAIASFLKGIKIFINFVLILFALSGAVFTTLNVCDEFGLKRIELFKKGKIIRSFVLSKDFNVLLLIFIFGLILIRVNI